jgi:hypothetical protein
LQIQALESQLTYVTNASYRKNTVEDMVLKFLKYLEGIGHEGFFGDGWTGEDVYQKWRTLSINREALCFDASARILTAPSKYYPGTVRCS